jgi:transketolase
MRSYEMVRLNMGYMGFNIKLVGLAAGFGMPMFGNTHYGMEDMALMRAVPGLCILSPCDCAEVAKATEAAAHHEGPVYLRLTGVAGNPIVYKNDYDFKIGRAITLREGSDIAIIATGTMVYESLEAAKLLEAQGISATVINMHTIKPIDTPAIDSVLDRKLIVTVEEHSVIGGLGAAVAEYKSRLASAPAQLFLGIEDKFKKAGNYKYLLQQNGLTAAQITANIIERFRK